MILSLSADNWPNQSAELEDGPEDQKERGDHPGLRFFIRFSCRSVS